MWTSCLRRRSAGAPFLRKDRQQHHVTKLTVLQRVPPQIALPSEAGGGLGLECGLVVGEHLRRDLLQPQLVECLVQAERLGRAAHAPAPSVRIGDVPAPLGTTIAIGQPREAEEADRLSVAVDDPAASVLIGHKGQERGLVFAPRLRRLVGHPAIHFTLPAPGEQAFTVVGDKVAQVDHGVHLGPVRSAND